VGHGWQMRLIYCSRNSFKLNWLRKSVKNFGATLKSLAGITRAV